MAYAPVSSSSSSRPLPRESIYPSPPPSDFLNHLEDCVSATEKCVLNLQNGLDGLRSGTDDLPRLTKILRNRHHYLLLPHTTIVAHKAVLSSSLAPQIDQLIAKAENMLETSSAKEARLEERIQILNSTRLPKISNSPISQPQTFSDLDAVPQPSSSVNPTNSSKSHLEDMNMKELSVVQRRKVAALKARRDRLEKEKDRLGLD